jgi:UDP-N-acetylmuramate dehydrogenase
MINIISDYLKEKRCIVKNDESLKEYNTFKIGGTAELLVMPEDSECLTGLIKIIKENNIKYYILGNGSNVLIADKYFHGVFIILSRKNNIDANGSEFIYADCGAALNKLAGVARDNNLSGLEFAYGIPGTLGGAVVMNAGAYGGQMSDVIYSSEYLDLDTLEIKIIGEAAHEFSYRHSIFDEHKLILSCCLKLKAGDKREIEAAMLKNMSARKEKQPLDYPSAGSVFKRGEHYFAAQLIDECGLKGASIGGAQVSEKHAGFIINKGGASFSDVLELIKYVQSAVYEKTGIKLEREVKIIE